MTKKEVNKILNILSRIKDPDAHVTEAILICKKLIANYDARKGQIKEGYEYCEVNLDIPTKI